MRNYVRFNSSVWLKGFYIPYFGAELFTGDGFLLEL